MRVVDLAEAGTSTLLNAAGWRSLGGRTMRIGRVETVNSSSAMDDIDRTPSSFLATPKPITPYPSWLSETMASTTSGDRTVLCSTFLS